MRRALVAQALVVQAAGSGAGGGTGGGTGGGVGGDGVGDGGVRWAVVA